MTTDSQLALGRHVAEQRRRLGWSQRDLARRLGKPVDWVSKLERGLLTPELIPLLGTPLREKEPAPEPGDGPHAEQAAALRRVVTGPFTHQARPEAMALQTAAGRRSLEDRVAGLTRGNCYGDLAELAGVLVPALIATLRTASRPHKPGLFRLLAGCYQACSTALGRLGDYDSAAAAAREALAAAECADDALAVAASAYLLVCSLVEDRQDEAGRIPRASQLPS
jgi:Helix-turn-helix domain